MLDQIVTAAEQKIPPQLALKLPPTSDAVVPSGRKDVVFWPQGGNSYSSTGVRSFSFRVSSDSAWLSTSSLMLALSLSDASSVTNALHCPAYSLTDRVTCRAAGTEIFRIDHYGRWLQCLYSLSDPQEIANAKVGAGKYDEPITSTAKKFVFPLICPLNDGKIDLSLIHI